MTEVQLGSLFLAVGLLLILSRVLSAGFRYFRQPPLIGEILAGILVGPFVLGNLHPALFEALFSIGQGNSDDAVATVFNSLYWIGLILLMFLTGSEVRNLLSKENRRPIGWILAVGTPLPFLIVMLLGVTQTIPLTSLTGEKGDAVSALLILASATAVTSIPVISRIFHDLGIIKTRFASLILGSAVIEDIALWGILSFAVSYAASVSIDGDVTQVTALHIALNLIYLAIALVVMPRLLTFLRIAKWNVFYQKTPVVYIAVVVVGYLVTANFMQTSLVFAAFLAGYGIVGGVKGRERKYYKASLSAMSKTAYALFIPLYFALVGFRLVFDGSFSISMLLIFLVGSTLLVFASMSLAARLAGFRGLSIINIAMATNARGGPGIILASVAFEARIISSAFYTTLVLSALVTSQLAGWWLKLVLDKKWPLLSVKK